MRGNFVRGAKTVADLVIVVALLCFEISSPSQYRLGITGDGRRLGDCGCISLRDLFLLSLSMLGS